MMTSFIRWSIPSRYFSAGKCSLAQITVYLLLAPSIVLVLQRMQTDSGASADAQSGEVARQLKLGELV